MIDKNFVNAYLTDINVICEDRNFFGTFNTPDDLLEVYLDKDDLEFRLTQRILNNASREFKKRFQSIFEYIEIDLENPEKINIHFHLPYDDYTEEEKEQFLQEVQDCLI